MSQGPKPPRTAKGPRPQDNAAAARRARSAEALRDNLRRRKLQARRRAEAGKDEPVSG